MTVVSFMPCDCCSRRGRRTGAVFPLVDDAPAVYGHVRLDEFREAMIAADYWDVDDEEAEPHEGPVLHKWWRLVPAPPDGDVSMFVIDAEPHSRGAFAVTVLSKGRQ